MWSHGNFYWNELMTRDAERAKAFYERSIGWDFEGMSIDGDHYWIAKVDGKPVGGIFEMKGSEFENTPEHWMSYLAVDDIDRRLAKAVEAGAVAMRQPFDVPGVGRIAILQEPGGAVIGWMTPLS